MQPAINMISGMKMRLIIGITGASGAIYAKRLLEVLHDASDVSVDLVITPYGRYIIEYELGIASTELEKLATRVWDINDMAADIASGSQPSDGMVIIPCTMNTLAKLAHGIADNLLLRASDVILKNGKKLVIVPRESPLNETHLENLLRLKQKGVTILPPSPAFYHHPESVTELVDFIVALILDQFNLPHALVPGWKKP